MNISRTWKPIAAVLSAIALITGTAKSVKQVVMSDFWNNLNPWHFMMGLAVLALLALGIIWFMERQNFRFASVAKAIADVRKELREGVDAKILAAFQKEAESRAGQYQLLTERLTALEKTRAGKD